MSKNSELLNAITFLEVNKLNLYRAICFKTFARYVISLERKY